MTQKIIKRIVSLALILLCCLSLVITAWAETSQTVYIPEAGVMFTLPEYCTALTRDASAFELETFGITVSDWKDYLESLNGYLDVIIGNEKDEIFVTVVDSDIDDLDSLSDVELQTLVAETRALYSDVGFRVDDVSIYQNSQKKYVVMYGTIAMDIGDVDKIMYATVNNGSLITIVYTHYLDGTITGVQKQMVKEIIDSLKYDSSMIANRPEEMDRLDYTGSLVSYIIPDTPLTIAVPENWTVLSLQSTDDNVKDRISTSYFAELKEQMRNSNTFACVFSSAFGREIDFRMFKERDITSTSVIDFRALYGDNSGSITLKNISDFFKQHFTESGHTVEKIEDMEAEEAVYLLYELDDCNSFVALTLKNSNYYIIRMDTMNGVPLSNAEKEAFIEMLSRVGFSVFPNLYDCMSIAALFILIASLISIIISVLTKIKHIRLKSSLDEKMPNIIGKKKRFHFNRMWILSLLLITAIVVLSIFSTYSSYFGTYVANTSADYLPFIFVLFLFLNVSLLVFVMVVLKERKINQLNNQKAQRSAQDNKNDMAQKVDPNNTILYLRPFFVDANSVTKKVINGERRAVINSAKKRANSFKSIKYRGKNYSDIEAVICKAVEDEGFMIAIGDPKEVEFNDSPVEGAGRVYGSDETWKEIVEKYFINSRRVIIYVDFTEGVKWELEQAIDKYQDKVIFIPKIYNKHKGALSILAHSPLTALFFYPLYFFDVKCLALPYLRRGKNYYKEWNKRFGFSISDKTCAVYYEDGAPVICENRSGDIESQLNSILSALNSKNKKFKILKEEIINSPLAIPAYLTQRENQDGDWMQNVIADGMLYFTENGMAYRQSSIIRRIFNLLNIERNLALKRIQSKDISYANLYSVEAENGRITISTEEVNGNYNLFLPYNIADFDKSISTLMMECKTLGIKNSLTEEENGRIVNILKKRINTDASISTMIFLVSGILIAVFIERWPALICTVFGNTSAKQSSSKVLRFCAVMEVILLLAFFIIL